MSKDTRAKKISMALGIGYAHALRLMREVWAETNEKITLAELTAACARKLEQ